MYHTHRINTKGKFIIAQFKIHNCPYKVYVMKSLDTTGAGSLPEDRYSYRTFSLQLKPQLSLVPTAQLKLAGTKYDVIT